MSVANSIPIFDYPENAKLVRTTWFDQWCNAIKSDFNAKTKVAMKRLNMRINILELMEEAVEVS